MSSNSTNSTTSDGGGGKDDGLELIVAIVALVISVFAFIIAIFQALQQYYASATGYSNCSRKVMADWGKFRHRRFKWSEFRFEVQFQTPVIFVAPPTNKYGPLGEHKKTPITYMVGTPESYKDTHTWDQKQFDQQNKKLREGKTRQAIHTADNELANWLGLLMAIQRMEKESREWHHEKYSHNPLYEADVFCHPDETNPKPTHTLAVGLQQKKKSWDSMPDNMKKPYATTTISHLVEMAAMLGIYWKEFNRNEDRYRAQGNGFMIDGYDVDDLGVVFTFQKTGPTWFQANRVIPNDKVKELCFGYCPTIFRREGDTNHKYADEPKDIGTLQMGSMSAIAETLVCFGCNTNTVKYFRKATPDTRHTHLFPVAFELIGMAGAVLQIPQTVFRMLPNPTVWHWDKKSFSLGSLLSSFTETLKDLSHEDTLLDGEGSWVPLILAAASQVESELQKLDVRAPTLEPANNTSEEPYTMALIQALHSGITSCDKELQKEKHLSEVRNVLRVHFQEILHILNDKDGQYKSPANPIHVSDTARTNGTLDAEDPSNPFVSTTKEEAPKAREDKSLLQQLDSASSSERHGVLVDIYLNTVRTRVLHQLKGERIRKERGAKSITSGTSSELLVKQEEQLINNVWCMLVFRMICWLLLHDFHGKDIQIEKSEVFGSRMPVYIT